MEAAQKGAEGFCLVEFELSVPKLGCDFFALREIEVEQRGVDVFFLVKIELRGPKLGCDFFELRNLGVALRVTEGF